MDKHPHDIMATDLFSMVKRLQVSTLMRNIFCQAVFKTFYFHPRSQLMDLEVSHLVAEILRFGGMLDKQQSSLTEHQH